MPSQEEFDELKGRIVELENQLREREVKRDISSITAEEMQAFVKVRDVIAGDWGEFCGINDCFRCVIQNCGVCIVRCLPPPCIFECNCGPCGVCQVGRSAGGAGRFAGLGG